MAQRRTIRSQDWRVSSAGPFTAALAAASNLSVGSGIVVFFFSLAHLTASARFRAGPPGSISGRLCGTAAWRGRPSCPGFPLRFRYRHSLLGHPMPAEELGAPHGRLTGAQCDRTSTGLPLSTRSSYGRGGCLLYPEDGGAPPGRGTCSAGACRSAAASPSTPLQHSHPRGAMSYEASVGGLGSSPVRPAPRLYSRMGRAPLGFPSSFAPRRYRRRTSRAGPGR